MLLLCVVSGWALTTRPDNRKPRPKGDIIELRRADVTFYNRDSADVQIYQGNVEFFHNGITLQCDSAEFWQGANAFKAYGNVHMRQGDTLSLLSDYLFYDGSNQLAEARFNVILTHRDTKLYTDSLNYDRYYNMGYFFEGGRLEDKDMTLTSDWGQYETSTRHALFNYNVDLVGKDYHVQSDTLYYNVETKLSHMKGPSNVQNGETHIYTEDGYFNTESKQVLLLNRSKINNRNQTLIGDSICYDEHSGIAEAFYNVYLNDKQKKSIITGDYCFYDDSTGYAKSYGNTLVRNYSERDTLYLHADTFLINTFYHQTDSAYRIVQGYHHARSYREDVQSVADSLCYDSRLKRLELQGNPILWNEEKQVLGEVIYAHFNDSTLDSVHIVRQCLMAEQLDSVHFNQVAGNEMKFYFTDGEMCEARVIGNVLVNYFAYDDDSLMIGMNHTETSLMRLFMENRQASRIWTRESEGTFYPLPFVTTEVAFLENYAWFDYMRPTSPDDVFVWRPKKAGTELKPIIRREVPYQMLKNLK